MVTARTTTRSPMMMTRKKRRKIMESKTSRRLRASSTMEVTQTITRMRRTRKVMMTWTDTCTS